MCACLAHVARGTGDRSACLAAAFWTCRYKWVAAVAVGSDVVIGVPYSAEHVMKVNVSSNTVQALALSDDFTGNSAPTATCVGVVRQRRACQGGGAGPGEGEQCRGAAMFGTEGAGRAWSGSRAVQWLRRGGHGQWCGCVCVSCACGERHGG